MDQDPYATPPLAPTDNPSGVSRRYFIRAAGGMLLAGATVGGLLSACSTHPAPPSPTTPPAAGGASPIAGSPSVPSPSALSASPVASPSVIASGSGKTIRAAFVYTGPADDHGWSNAHDDGRKALEQALGSQVETAYTENIAETADSQRVFEDYARQGYDVVYGTSFGYMDYMLATAQEFPNVKFEHCSGFKTADNMSTYYAAEEEPRYVSGIIAGKMTKTNVLGFVGSFPIPEVVRFLNAWGAGVQSVNADARIHTVWISTWFDPPKERDGAQSLLDLNADVITGTADSPSPAQAAAARGMYAIGVDYDQSSYAPQAVLNSDRFIWAPHYIKSVQSILNGSWQPIQVYYHTRDGIVEATQPSSIVPTDIAQLAMATQDNIRSGQLNIWSGPLTDNHGTVRAAAGQSLGNAYTGPPPPDGQSADDAYVQGDQMNWALSNIVGDIPSS